MKLKKAMKKYDIHITKAGERSPLGNECRNEQYEIGQKRISQIGLGNWRRFACHDVLSESEAVAWLVEGAKKLSPMERAMRKYPINKKDDSEDATYILGKRHVFHFPGRDFWMECDTGDDMTKYTEEEAVAYLLEGYKVDELKPKEPVVIKMKSVNICNSTSNFSFEPNPSEAQKICDQLYHAGYRPTKD